MRAGKTIITRAASSLYEDEVGWVRRQLFKAGRLPAPPEPSLETPAPAPLSLEVEAALAALPSCYRTTVEADYRRRGQSDGLRWLRWLAAGLPPSSIMDASESLLADLSNHYAVDRGRHHNLPAGARPTDPKWWRRYLRQMSRQGRETVAIRLGLVGGDRPYASCDAHGARSEQLACQERWMSETSITDGTIRIKVADAYRASSSNPRCRAAELSVRAYSLCEVEHAAGRVPVFATLTVPARFHRRRLDAKSGRWVLNRGWDGTLPDAAHAWFQRRWTSLQQDARWRRINVRGLLTAEPHTDGTPHYHAVLYSDNNETLATILRAYLLTGPSCYPDERGAERHRIKIAEVRGKPADFDGTQADYTRRSAVKYIVKYIRKNVIGDLVDHDGSSLPQLQAVEAWRATWGVRAFRFLGEAGGVTVWRELRRYANLGETGEVVSEPLAEAIMAATANDWTGFQEIAQGLGLRVLKAEEAETAPEGLAPGKVVGVQIDGEKLLTRAAHWRIAPPRAPVIPTAPGTNKAGAAPGAPAPRIIMTNFGYAVGSRSDDIAPGYRRALGLDPPLPEIDFEAALASVLSRPALTLI